MGDRLVGEKQTGGGQLGRRLPARVRRIGWRTGEAIAGLRRRCPRTCSGLARKMERMCCVLDCGIDKFRDLAGHQLFLFWTKSGAGERRGISIKIRDAFTEEIRSGVRRVQSCPPPLFLVLSRFFSLLPNPRCLNKLLAPAAPPTIPYWHCLPPPHLIARVQSR